MPVDGLGRRMIRAVAEGGGEAAWASKGCDAVGHGLAFGLSFGLIHLCPGLFTGDRGAACPTWSGRSRMMANAGAQSSKACEGATPPWVQIPPPPPLTCKNTSPGGRQASAPCARGLIWWSQLRVVGSPAAGSSCSCCAWSRMPRTGLNKGAHALGSCACEFTASQPVIAQAADRCFELTGVAPG